MIMRFFRKFIFPPLYGLLVYFTVRILQDTQSGFKFWERELKWNVIEIGFSILTGFAGIMLFDNVFRYFDRRDQTVFSYSNILKEIFMLIIANLVLVNIIFTPISAFTDDGLSWADFVSLNLIPTLYAIVYYGIWRTKTYMQAYIANGLQLEKVKNEHLQTELKFLKAQYHPHFLFNALNTIYFQMDEDVAATKISIEKFSDLLRYQLYDQQQLVPVEREIGYLQSFMELQIMRSSERLVLTAVFDEKLCTQMVYPLLFLPFVENAFKFIGGDYEMLVEAELKDDMIIFKVENSIPATKPAIGKAGGIGLENLKRRLDILYPGKHEINITEDKEIFSAELKLKYE